MISFEERNLQVGCLVDNTIPIYEDLGVRPLWYLNVQKLSLVLSARSCWCSALLLVHSTSQHTAFVPLPM